MNSALDIERRPDGSLVLRNTQELSDVSGTLVDWLEHWAQTRPRQPFVAEREAGGWRELTYDDALRAARRLGRVLLEQGAGPERPLLVLARNGIAHVKLMLAALYAGVPVASVASAYAANPHELTKLNAVFATLQPIMVFAQEGAAPALEAMDARYDFSVLASSEVEPAKFESAAVMTAARAKVCGDGVAKIMFTSGSTGAPKGVVHTHRMWSTNQQQIAQGWPFLEEEPPVLLDWLPWSHTFGGNHNLGIVLRHGGTLYVDDGNATPQGIDRTVRNLREIAPTLFFNVPKGYDLLLPALERDVTARRNLFLRLRLLKSAAAALPVHLAVKLRELAHAEGLGSLPIVTGWGATETAPAITATSLDAGPDAGIGLPLPGVELKMLPAGANFELRVRGPNVTPGYWRRSDLRASMFDEEGFYRIGDLGRFVDAERPERGIAFAGRIAEEFKLSTGTWVQVSPLRLRAIEAFAPLVQDAAVAGENRDFVGLLLFMNFDQCRAFLGDAAAAMSETEIAREPRIVNHLRRAMAELARRGGSSTYPARCLIELDAPVAARGEITDKGYLNQGAVLRQRAASVQRLYAPLCDSSVIQLD